MFLIKNKVCMPGGKGNALLRMNISCFHLQSNHVYFHHFQTISCKNLCHFQKIAPLSPQAMLCSSKKLGTLGKLPKKFFKESTLFVGGGECAIWPKSDLNMHFLLFRCKIL